MVRKSLYCTLLLLIIYGVYIKFFKPQPVAQQQFQMNTIKAQKYMYTDSLKGFDVILGTSISAKMKTNMFPPHLYSLAFGGQSVLDGIDMVEYTGRHPKYVFVETNSVLTPESPGLVNYLFNAPNYYRKKYFPFMRDNYQPAGQLFKNISAFTTHAIHGFTRYIYNPALNLVHKGRINLVDKRKFYAKAKMRRSTIDTVAVNQAFLDLKAHLAKLEKGGSKICFYAVPNERDVYYSIVAEYIRNRFFYYFPKSVYTYLPEADLSKYHTVDQIHLDDTSAVKYTRLFVKEVDSVRNGGH